MDDFVRGAFFAVGAALMIWGAYLAGMDDKEDSAAADCRTRGTIILHETVFSCEEIGQ